MISSAGYHVPCKDMKLVKQISGQRHQGWCFATPRFRIIRGNSAGAHRFIRSFGYGEFLISMAWDVQNACQIQRRYTWKPQIMGRTRTSATCTCLCNSLWRPTSTTFISRAFHESIGSISQGITCVSMLASYFFSRTKKIQHTHTHSLSLSLTDTDACKHSVQRELEAVLAL
jgi:hypothetical protein